MAVDERRRHELYEHAKSQWGEEAAVTLMELLPPVGWADVATKVDLAQLEGRLPGEFRTATADLRVELHDALREQTNRILAFVVPALLSGVGLAFVAARFG